MVTKLYPHTVCNFMYYENINLSVSPNSVTIRRNAKPKIPLTQSNTGYSP